MCFWLLDIKLKNGDGMEMVETLQNYEEIGVFHQDLLNQSLGNGNRDEVRPLKKVCYRIGDETGDWTWRNRGRGGSAVSLLVSMVRVVCGFSESACWRLGQTMSWGKEVWKGKI